MESVVTGNAESVKKILERKPQYRECLFSRGYMITEDAALDETQYPFYGNWTRVQLNAQFTAFVHKDQDKHLYTQGDKAFFLVGHAYNPFNGVYREEELLRQCGAAYEKSREAFFEAVNEWTGIFAIYVLDGGEVIAAQDCAGVKAVYFGEVNGKLCFLSHPQMAADIYGLQMGRLLKSWFPIVFTTSATVICRAICLRLKNCAVSGQICICGATATANSRYTVFTRLHRMQNARPMRNTRRLYSRRMKFYIKI